MDPAPAYNVQTAVDAEHAIIIAQQVTTDSNDYAACCRWPRPRSRPWDHRKRSMSLPIRLLQWRTCRRCEATGIIPHVPAQPVSNNKGDGTLFDRTHFHYRPEDRYLPMSGWPNLGETTLAERLRGDVMKPRLQFAELPLKLTARRLATIDETPSA